MPFREFSSVISSACDLLSTSPPPLACVWHHHYPSRPFSRPIPRSEATLDVGTTSPSPSPPPCDLGENGQISRAWDFTNASLRSMKHAMDATMTRTQHERVTNMTHAAAMTTRTSLFLFVLGDVVTMQTLQSLQTTVSGLASGLRALSTCI